MKGVSLKLGKIVDFKQKVVAVLEEILCFIENKNILREEHYFLKNDCLLIFQIKTKSALSVSNRLN